MTPAGRLVDLLAAARRVGVAFDQAWPRAVAEALEDVAGVDLEDWRQALEATRAEPGRKHYG